MSVSCGVLNKVKCRESIGDDYRGGVPCGGNEARHDMVLWYEGASARSAATLSGGNVA